MLKVTAAVMGADWVISSYHYRWTFWEVPNTDLSLVTLHLKLLIAVCLLCLQMAISLSIDAVSNVIEAKLTERGNIVQKIANGCSQP